MSPEFTWRNARHASGGAKERERQRGHREAGSHQRWQSHQGGCKKTVSALHEDVTLKYLWEEKPQEELSPGSWIQDLEKLLECLSLTEIQTATLYSKAGLG